MSFYYNHIISIYNSRSKTDLVALFISFLLMSAMFFFLFNIREDIPLFYLVLTILMGFMCINAVIILIAVSYLYIKYGEPKHERPNVLFITDPRKISPFGKHYLMPRFALVAPFLLAWMLPIDYKANNFNIYIPFILGAVGAILIYLICKNYFKN